MKLKIYLAAISLIASCMLARTHEAEAIAKPASGLCPRVNIASTLRSFTFPDAFHPEGVQIFKSVGPGNDFIGDQPLFAMYQELNEIPAFACFGLRLTPNDLRHVRRFGELVNVVAWGLREAQKRNGDGGFRAYTDPEKFR